MIEVDGSQHFEEENRAKDKERDTYLMYQEIKVLRFDNLEVLKNTQGVLEVVLKTVAERKVVLNEFF